MLKAGDGIKSIILLLLDLLAALDTLFITQTGESFWRKRQCSLLVSFISSVFFVNSTESSLKQYGVPQGSVSGPLLYSLYISPLGDIAWKALHTISSLCR